MYIYKYILIYINDVSLYNLDYFIFEFLIIIKKKKKKKKKFFFFFFFFFLYFINKNKK